MIGIAIAGTLVAFNFSSIRAALFPPEFTEDTNPTAGPAAVSTEPTQISTSLIPDGLWSEVLDKGYILIANDPDFAPQSSLKTVGFRPGDSKCPADSLTSAEMQGFDVDVAVRISENLGVEPCFVSPPWDEIAAGNWNAGWDIHVGSMTITTSRQAVLDFSVPYYFNPAVVAVYEGVDVDTLDDLAGRTLCAQAGSTYESWLTHAPMELPASSIFFDAPEKVSSLVLDTDTLCAENVVELKGLKVLVGYVTSQWVVDAQIADGLPLRRLGSAVFSEDLAIAFDKNSSYPTSSLRKRVDEIITQMHED